MTATPAALPLFGTLAPIIEFMRGLPAPRTPESEGHVVDLIYRTCHGRQDARGPGAPGHEGDAGLTRDFVARLSNANCGVGPQHDGWAVRLVEDDGRLAVERDGLTLWVDPEPGAAPGERVRVRFPKEYRNLYPGHYVVIGDADRGELRNPIRLYWHVGAEGAEQLVRTVSSVLNRSNVPFRLKVLSAPGAYRRADAGILYLPPEYRAEGPALIQDIYLAVRTLMRPSVSAFVLPLAPGLGLAEDPHDGSSFGMHRSRLVAQLLFSTLDLPDPLAGLAAALKTAGYPPDRFHLNPDSGESYGSWRFDAD